MTHKGSTKYQTIHICNSKTDCCCCCCWSTTNANPGYIFARISTQHSCR